MRFPPPQSSEALPGVQERSGVSRALAMCSGAINFLPTRVELSRHLLRESQAHLSPAASAIFSDKAWQERGQPVWGRPGVRREWMVPG